MVPVFESVVAIFESMGVIFNFGVVIFMSIEAIREFGFYSLWSQLKCLWWRLLSLWLRFLGLWSFFTYFWSRFLRLCGESVIPIFESVVALIVCAHVSRAYGRVY